MISEPGPEAWRVSADDYPRDAAVEERVAFLLGYAVLAPSSHNTQPWRFRVEGPAVEVFADLSGWVADPDRRELYQSLGCAIEHLFIAARHFGFAPRVVYGSGAVGEPEATVAFEGAGPGPSVPDVDGLFEAITARHTNHGAYDGRVVPDPLRKRLEGVATEIDIQIHLTDDPEVRERVDEADRPRRRHSPRSTSIDLP